jgi:hypothetical protein
VHRCATAPDCKGFIDLAHRSIGYVHAANWVFAAVIGFLFMIQWDEQVSLPVSGGISVFADGDSAVPAALTQEIEAFAREHEITFAQEERDFDDWHGGRILYLVDGDPSVPGSDWLSGEFDDFSKSVDTQVRPFADMEGDAAGAYVVFGDTEKTRQLADYLASQGLRTEAFEVHPWSTVLPLVDRSMFTALYIMFLVSIAIVGAGVLLSTRAYGVSRLQGLSLGSLLAGDLKSLAKVWAVAGAATLALTLTALWIYNGFVGAGAYLGVVLAIDLALTATAVAAHAMVLTLTMQVRILGSVKGELPGRTASAIAYALRLTTVVIALALVAQVIALGADLSRRERVFDEYERLGTMSTITLGGMASIEEEDELLRVVGSWLRQEDQDGHLLLAGERTLPSPDPLLADHTVLYVNEKFLKAQEIRSAEGTAFPPEIATAGPRVLVPTDLWERRTAVTQALAADVSLSDPGLLATTEPLESEGGQAVFTYNSEGAGGGPGALEQDQSYTTDPVIVVLPSASGILTDSGYIAFATGQSVLFPDPEVVTAALAEDPALSRFVISVTPVAANAAEEARDLRREFRLSLFSAFAAALVLIITGIGTVLVHARQNAQWIFARHVSGWRYTAVHRLLLAFELCVLAVLVGWMPYQIWSQNREITRMYGDRPPFALASPGAPEWASIGLLSLVAVGGVLAALALIHRRVIRDGASEA